MPTSENDVLDLMNRAAMDAPSMSLAAHAVLSSAQNRRRKQRQTRGGMALAAFTAAGTIWFGAGSGLGDLLGTQVDSAGLTPSPAEWDDSVSFKTPVPDGGDAYSGFEGSSLVRDAGEDFVIEFADGSPTLTPTEGQLPAGVESFTNDGDTLVVSEARFDASPVLGFSADAYRNGSRGVPLTDGDQQVFVWFLEEFASASEVQDVYWLLPDQVATSTDAAVINEVVADGDDEVTVIITPETDQWGKRTSSGLEDLLPLSLGDDVVLDPPSDGDLWVSVIPGWAKNPVFGPPGSFDTKPMSTRAVGDYLIAWATSSERDLDGRPALAQWDRPASMGLTETSTVTVVADGDAVKVVVEGTMSEMTVASGNTGARAAEAADGSALVIAAFPEGISSIDGPPGPATAAPQTASGCTRTLLPCRRKPVRGPVWRSCQTRMEGSP